ncbi:hypothetical protein FN846DRAFT_946132 [Sphaerosporella brunnea]|uniref:FUN14 family-domain-containing protein n=1 Tax=Sphaerosporella brunnea TaxID=1250544 RepID=A0A5J5EZA9_9PEZI|nr:hypothetical protein FN846DRAFT_946132 [Sphaerosporella brunnea]
MTSYKTLNPPPVNFQLTIFTAQAHKPSNSRRYQTIMAYRLFTPRILTPTVTLLAGGGLYHHHNRPLRCESVAPCFGFPFPFPWRKLPMAPPPRNRNGYDPTVYRQISTGSFVGVALGLCVARFGKSIAIVLGGILLIIEALARQGINLLPNGRITQWVQEVDLMKMVQKNTAFKVSFGAAFILTALYG